MASTNSANGGNKFLTGLMEGKWFYYLSFSFILNPLFLLLQLYRAIHSADTQSLSSLMFGGFAFLNVVTGLAGAKIKNTPMVLSCGASFVIAIAIVVVAMK
jgi:hypothetical protein